MTVSATRMDDKPRRFVDNHKHIILIYDIQRNLLGHNTVVIRRSVIRYDNLIKRLYLVIALDYLAVHDYRAGIGRLLYLVARSIRYMVYKEFINADR